MLLREYVFIHVERPLEKLNALIAMTGKLFTLVADLCGEDNADALSHHEVLLPGTLLSKFVSDKLAECLAIFKRQVKYPRQHLQNAQPTFAQATMPFAHPQSCLLRLEFVIYAFLSLSDICTALVLGTFPC